MEPNFYHRLFEAWHVLVDFFHAGGKGLSIEVLETSPDHVVVLFSNLPDQRRFSEACQNAVIEPNAYRTVDRKILQGSPKTTGLRTPAWNFHTITLTITNYINQYIVTGLVIVSTK